MWDKLPSVLPAFTLASSPGSLLDATQQLFSSLTPLRPTSHDPLMLRAAGEEEEGRQRPERRDEGDRG